MRAPQCYLKRESTNSFEMNTSSSRRRQASLLGRDISFSRRRRASLLGRDISVSRRRRVSLLGLEHTTQVSQCFLERESTNSFGMNTSFSRRGPASLLRWEYTPPNYPMHLPALTPHIFLQWGFSCGCVLSNLTAEPKRLAYNALAR